MNLLILPGYGDSGADHWQSHWQTQLANCQRITDQDWWQPHCRDWVASLEGHVQALGENTLLIAHSLAALQVVHWAAQTTQRIVGALLVAVPDPQGDNFPAQAQGFSPLPQTQLPFPCLMLTSSNDPYASSAFSQRCAEQWTAEHIDLGPLGHINGDSGLAAWPKGQALLREWLRGLPAHT